MSNFLKKASILIKSKLVIGIVSSIIILIGVYFLFFRHTIKYQFVTVKRGSITELVSLTGNTTPEKDVSLSFGSSGIVSHVYSSLGEKVNAGQVLTELNTNDLIALLHQSQADVDQQKARLESLQSGARPEDIALYKQKYSDASSAFVIAMNNSYLQTESAVLHYVDTIFSNGATSNPIIKVNTQSQDEERSVEMSRLITGEKLAKWKAVLVSLNTSSSDKDLNNARSVEQDAIVFISDFTNHLGTIVGNLSPESSSLSQSQIDTDRANINTAAQTISSGSAAEQAAYGVWTSSYQTLVSQESGSKPEDIKAQISAVEAAQAGVESVLAKIENAQITAPIGGVVTQFDAKIGQLASPNVPLVSIMADTGYEVDAGVSETDVGKVLVGDKVTMTLDAFPNETFLGSVFYIAPAETNTQGVISYQIKISFDKLDPRLKSGLTANINIQTKNKDSVLILPQSGILQNDQGTFVEVLENNQIKQKPVTLGIQDQKGNAEVVSGVTEGEQVLNIGLKI